MFLDVFNTFDNKIGLFVDLIISIRVFLSFYENYHKKDNFFKRLFSLDASKGLDD